MNAEELRVVREQCGSWDEDAGCLEENPEECPYYAQCQEGEITEEGEPSC